MTESDAFGFMDRFTGGSFENMSILALNITPYITSSIIIQLLTIAIPKFEEWQRDGEDGRKKLTALTRYITVALALIESIAMSIGFYRNTGFLNVFGGGADCYIPDLFGGESLNVTCFLVGIIVAVVYVVNVIRKRAVASSKGYEVEPFYSALIKMVIICAAVVWFFYKLAQYKGIPTSLIWIGIVLLSYAYITSNTTMGRYLYAVGGNEKATTLSGIDSRKVYFFAYVNMGLMAGLGGILTIARATQAQPTFGQGYEMDAIAACFIGGASAYGGEGNVFGIVIGALLMGVINMGMSIMGTDANYQKVIKGLVVLGAIIFDVLSNKKKN